MCYDQVCNQTCDSIRNQICDSIGDQKRIDHGMITD